MKRLLLDTNAYAALMAGDTRVADALAKAEAILISSIVLGELLDGFLNGSRERQNRELLERFLAKPRTVKLPITPDTAEHFAAVKRQLRRKGKPIPTNDVWIAASCLEHGATLLSFDTHFAEVDGILRWEP